MQRIYTIFSFSLYMLLWLPTTIAYAEMQQNLFAFPNVEQNNKFVQLTKQLRCTVCQNQSLYDSMAPLAVDLKVQIQQMLTAGKDEPEIIQYLVSRYGNFVLYNPPLKYRTALLWFAPILLLGGGIGALVVTFKK